MTCVELNIVFQAANYIHTAILYFSGWLSMSFGNRSVPLPINIHLARVTWLCSGWLVVHYVHKRESVFPKNQPEKYSIGQCKRNCSPDGPFADCACLLAACLLASSPGLPLLLSLFDRIEKSTEIKREEFS